MPEESGPLQRDAKLSFLHEATYFLGAKPPRTQATKNGLDSRERDDPPTIKLLAPSDPNRSALFLDAADASKRQCAITASNHKSKTEAICFVVV